MSHQNAWTIPIQPPAPMAVANDSDPALALMLAQQATSRLRFDLRSLEESVVAARDPSLTRQEAEIAISRIDVLEGRMRPFTSFVNQAVRFEAQEIVAALGGIRERLVEIRRRFEPPPRPPAAADVAARLLRRRG